MERHEIRKLLDSRREIVTAKRILRKHGIYSNDFANVEIHVEQQIVEVMREKLRRLLNNESLSVAGMKQATTIQGLMR